MNAQFVRGLSLAAGWLLCAAAVTGDPLGTAFTYQGELTVDGAPLDGSADLRFSLFDTLDGGLQVGPTLVFADVEVITGTFSVDLDFGADSFDGNARWLWLEVRSPHDPTDVEAYTGLVPRLPISPTPYALQTRGIFVDDEGNVRVGDGVGGASRSVAAAPPQAQFHSMNSNANEVAILGENTASTGASHGVHGISDSPDAAGIFGESMAATGPAAGVHGESASDSGRGVVGKANGASGETHGVHGEATSPDGKGVYGKGGASGVHGESDSAGGRGVVGKANGASGETHGVHGEATSPLGKGVYGKGGAIGVHGETDGLSGRGVSGMANSASGETIGVLGGANSSDGVGVYGWSLGSGVRGVSSGAVGTTYGVYGENNANSGAGVFGITNGSSGTPAGVYGRAPFAAAGRGVFGWASGSGMSTGVFGRSTSSNGRGVFGEALSGSGTGVQGDAGTGIGVFGRSIGVDGTGVHGWAQGFGSRGVFGECGNGVGVYGQSSDGTGVQGTVGGKDAAGVLGINTRTTSNPGDTPVGVRGEIASTSGDGVYGFASNKISGSANGVHGETASTTGDGVYGHASKKDAGSANGVRGVTKSICGVGVLGETDIDTPDDACPNAGVMGVNNEPYGAGVLGESSQIGGCSGQWNLVPYGVHGRSASPCEAAAGVLAQGSGTFEGAAALEIREGAINIGGTVRPAGTISVAPSLFSSNIIGDNGGDVIGHYADVSFPSALGDIILLTVEADHPGSSALSYSAHADPTGGKIRVTAHGYAAPSLSATISVHYLMLRSVD